MTRLSHNSSPTIGPDGTLYIHIVNIMTDDGNVDKLMAFDGSSGTVMVVKYA